jgi:hypothetical protein
MCIHILYYSSLSSKAKVYTQHLEEIACSHGDKLRGALAARANQRDVPDYRLHTIENYESQRFSGFFVYCEIYNQSQIQKAYYIISLTHPKYLKP